MVDLRLNNASKTQGGLFSGKAENVREFNICRGNARELTKSQGLSWKNLVWENCLLHTSRLGLHW